MRLRLEMKTGRYNRGVKMLNELAKEVHENAVSHGWWDKEPSFGEIIALCHSELSEALEEYRAGRTPTKIHFTGSKCKESGGFCVPDAQDECPNNPQECGAYKIGKPEGIDIELADCILRILDYCGHAGIDIDEAIALKHEYNKTRPYKHGGKRI